MLCNTEKTSQNKMLKPYDMAKMKNKKQKLSWHILNSSEDTIKILHITLSHVICIWGKWIFDANNTYALPLSSKSIHRCIGNVTGKYNEDMENVIQMNIIAGYEFTIPKVIVNKMKNRNK